MIAVSPLASWILVVALVAGAYVVGVLGERHL
jgi:hypothetical protein